MRDISITRAQVDTITKALNREEIDSAAIVGVIKQQIKEQGDCSPVLAHVNPAIISEDVTMLETSMHELRSIWRMSQVRYIWASRLALGKEIH